jgi:PAS domain S-box-containing protein
VANAGRGGSNRPARTAAVVTNGPGIDNIHRLLFEQMSSAVVIGETTFDEAGKPIDYRVVDVNPAFKRLAGLSADDLVGKRVLEVRPHLGPELIERAALVAVSGQPVEFERHDAESDRSVLIRLSRVGPTWVMAMIEDVTDRRRAEAVTRDRNAFIETIIASSGEGLVVFDRDLRYVVWNPRMEEMTGLAADQVLGRRARDIFPGTMAAGIEENVRRVLETGRPQSREFEYTVPQTGRSGWSLNTHRPHRDASGQIIGVIASVRDITARHGAEEALRQSEEQFRTIFDSVGDGVAIWEPGGHFLEVNRVVCERLGYTREELLAMPVGAINSPESAATIPERVELIMQGGAVSAIEATHVRRDGTEMPIEAVSRRVEFRGRLAILTVYRDMTERKRSEAALREQARLMQQLLDAIPIPIVAHYTDGRPRLANAAFAAGPGRPREGLVGRTYGELDQADAEMHAAHDRPVLEEGAVETYEANLYFPDGTARRQLLTKAPLRSPGGEIAGMVTAGLDISDRYRTEQALRQSEERFRTLFDFASDAIFIHDPTGNFIEVNRAACERLGYTRDELLAMSPSDLDMPEFAALVPERVSHLMAQGSAFFETAHRRRDGTVVPVELSAAVIDLGGHPAVLSIARDISERRQAETERAALEEQLRQAQKMEEIGRLAGGIAHDFNNLLTAIRGNASLALAQLPPDASVRDDLEQIEQASDRAAALTRQLLAFARRTVLQPEVVDLGAIVRRLEPMLRRLLGEDVELVTVCPPTRGAVLADPSQIEQVIVNLAVNARDAMPDGGTLTIETADVELDEAVARSHASATPGPNAMVAVSDTGIGMDAATLEHVFEPFFTTKGPGKGTGLGLATVYGIVRQSGGSIWARSEPGQGSTISIYLPWVETDSIASHRESPAEAEPRSEPRSGTILVVEDDDSVRGFATRVLERAGYEVLSAASGAVALAAHAGESFDLLLTDVVMPAMNGREVADRLLARHPGLRVMFMSGHADTTIVKHGILDPSIRYLPKPFTAQSLLAAVDAALAAPPTDPTAPEVSAG